MYFSKFILIFMILPAFVLAQDSNKTEEYRKYYGISLNNGCSQYFKVFKCMSTCKSLSYKIYRLDFLCHCSCHVMKTSTILPYFKWRTNGTQRVIPKTRSPSQYEVVGTLSPTPVETTTPPTTETTVDMCAGRFPVGWDLQTNSTGTDTGGTETGATGTAAETETTTATVTTTTAAPEV